VSGVGRRYRRDGRDVGSWFILLRTWCVRFCFSTRLWGAAELIAKPVVRFAAGQERTISRCTSRARWRTLGHEARDTRRMCSCDERVPCPGAEQVRMTGGAVEVLQVVQIGERGRWWTIASGPRTTTAAMTASRSSRSTWRGSAPSSRRLRSSGACQTPRAGARSAEAGAASRSHRSRLGRRLALFVLLAISSL
jgi:hypothetical protein